jgi:hypothetical protein
MITDFALAGPGHNHKTVGKIQSENKLYFPCRVSVCDNALIFARNEDPASGPESSLVVIMRHGHDPGEWPGETGPLAGPSSADNSR